jgi:hypothetical protein
MSKVQHLLGQGNTKLGENIHHFSIPAWETCPGRSAACRVCYARHGRYRTHKLQAILSANLQASQAGDFASRIVAEIGRRWCQVVRIHVAGDFYSAEYVAKWIDIATRCPRTTFYAYTRSWRIPAIVPALVALSSLENVRLWYSADDDTGLPSDVPPGVRVAYLLEVEGVPENVDLIFRHRPLRSTPARRIGLAMVCPVESGTGADTDCGRCGVCWE